MDELTVQEIEKILSGVKYPGFSRDIISFGVIQQIMVEKDGVKIEVKFTTKNEDTKSQITADIREAIEEKFSQISVIISESDNAPQQKESTKPGGDPWAVQTDQDQ